jgi:hypothetical protein
MNARGLPRLGLFTSGIALTALLMCGGYEPLPGPTSMATAASSFDSGGGVAGYVVGGTAAQSMGPGCERVRRPNCNRPGRRSTRR